jgi:acyl-CoA thioester hydrolase
MTTAFVKTFNVRWGDMDFNAHMKNTAYLDISGDVRMMYFAENDFPMSEFVRLKVGPVVMRDKIDYFRELRLLEPIRVNLTLAGLSDDASRFYLRNEFFREDGKCAARVTSMGGWMDLAARKLTTPPDKLAQVLHALVKSDDFQALDSSIRKAK